MYAIKVWWAALAALSLWAGSARTEAQAVYTDVFGMTLQQLTPQAVKLQGLESGVQVVAVAPDSEAARAGVTANDVIAGVNDVSITSVAELFDRLEKTPGRLTLRLRSDYGDKKLTIPRPKVSGRIVFQSERTGKAQIYVMNADGTGLTQMTHGKDAHSNPAWSPDGRRIVLTGAAPGRLQHLYTMNADGSSLRLVMQTPDFETLPRWSPDGEQIYFLSNRNHRWDICRVRANGSSLETVVECSPRPDAMAWSFPAFDLSPDGSFLIYPRYGDVGFHLAVLHLPTGTTFPMAAGLSNVLRPHWSRATNKIVVSDQEIRVVDMTSGSATPLRVAGFQTTDISSILWSPRADFFIVTARPSPREAPQLYLMSADGRLRRRLTFSTPVDEFADWTEGGKGSVASRK